MKYIRNSGRKPETEPQKKKSKKELTVTKKMETAILNQMLADAEWLEDLNATKKFSKEWIQTVLVEILMQCMGKKDVMITNMFGQQLVARVFKEKGAVKVTEIIAKMEGHLFDTIKGSIKQTGTIEHKHEVKLLPDSNRTGNVLDILESCGAFNVPVKRLTKDDVEIISA